MAAAAAAARRRARTSMPVPTSAAAAQAHTMRGTLAPRSPAIMGTARTVKVDSSDARDAAVCASANACGGGTGAGVRGALAGWGQRQPSRAAAPRPCLPGAGRSPSCPLPRSAGSTRVAATAGGAQQAHTPLPRRAQGRLRAPPACAPNPAGPRPWLPHPTLLPHPTTLLPPDPAAPATLLPRNPAAPPTLLSPFPPASPRRGPIAPASRSRPRSRRPASRPPARPRGPASARAPGMRPRAQSAAP